MSYRVLFISPDKGLVGAANRRDKLNLMSITEIKAANPVSSRWRRRQN
jgi:hypothetical protein